MRSSAAQMPVVPDALADAHALSFAQALALGRQRDPLGHKLHVGFGMLYAFTLALEAAPGSIGFALLLVMAVIRLPHTWPCYRFLARAVVLWLLLGWAAFHGLSILWSSDPSHGMTEWRAFRAVLTPLMLWPIVDTAGKLIAAFLLSVAVQNALQILNLAHILEFTKYSTRLGGLTHPNIAALLCVTAMCWHLTAVLNGTRNVRWISAAGFLAAAIGLVSTGGRSSWIAATIVIPLLVIIAAIRRPHTRKLAIAIAICGMLGAGGVYLAASDMIVTRYNNALDNVQRMKEGSYNTDFGHRVASWGIAWDTFLQSPVIGAGAGGYRTPKHHPRYGPLLDEYTHAHSVYMQVLACTGAIGAAIVLALFVLSLKGAWNAPMHAPYTDGTFFVMFSWMITALTDTHHDRGTTLGLLAFAITLVLQPMSVVHRGGRGARGDGNG